MSFLVCRVRSLKRRGLDTPTLRRFQVAGPCGARAGIPTAGGETMRGVSTERAPPVDPKSLLRRPFRDGPRLFA